MNSGKDDMLVVAGAGWADDNGSHGLLGGASTACRAARYSASNWKRLKAEVRTSWFILVLESDSGVFWMGKERMAALG